MNWPKDKHATNQPLLFDNARRLSGDGAVRSWVGDFFEEAGARLTGATRLRTSGLCAWCPDLRWDDRIGFECKAVGNSGSVIIYQCRLEKDLEQSARHGVELWYWIFRHTAPVLGTLFIDDLRQKLAAATIKVACVPLADLAAACYEMPLRRVNSAYTSAGKRLGYGQKQYGIGWTIRASQFFQSDSRLSSVSVYGQAIPRLQVHGEHATSFL
jgi:hypothetical protein